MHNECYNEMHYHYCYYYYNFNHTYFSSLLSLDQSSFSLYPHYLYPQTFIIRSLSLNHLCLNKSRKFQRRSIFCVKTFVRIAYSILSFHNNQCFSCNLECFSSLFSIRASFYCIDFAYYISERLHSG